MKIGIITFSFSVDNYGQILQCFALQRFLRDQGHDAFVIGAPDSKKNPSASPLYLALVHCALYAMNPAHLCRSFTEKYRGRMLKKEMANFPRHFEDFLHKYIRYYPVKYTSFSDLRENPPEADIYIAGSDQIWNENIICKRVEKQNPNIDRIFFYFLNFGRENIRRVSYSTSWGGGDAISAEFSQKVTPLLKRFSHISVREKTGLNICQKLGCVNAKCVCDPTLLLDAEKYRRIYRENHVRKPERKYLLIYHLNNTIDFNMQSIYQFATKKNLDVIYVTCKVVNKYEKFFATIPEWLYLVDNAEYMITNSFHGAVFATIFGKNYGVIPCTKEHASMNGRLDTFFEMCNIEPRWLEKGKGFVILDNPYTADFSAFRQESIQFLNDALGGLAKNNM